MKVNYCIYDDRNELSLSEACHLWLELQPVAKRDGQPHPSPTDSGWQYDFWRWLKEQAGRKGGRKIVGSSLLPRSLWLEIAGSEEYERLTVTMPQIIKRRPLFLFPDERPKWGPALAPAKEETRRWLVGRMRNGKKEKPKADYLEEARSLHGCSKPQFEVAWQSACAETGSGWDRGGRPRKPR